MGYKNTLTFSQILQRCIEKKHSFYYYLFKNNQVSCFGRSYKTNVKNANLLIQKAKCNNTGAKIACGFNLAYDLFYGNKHNHKMIITRPKEISKLTTRLDFDQIKMIEGMFKT
jgi:hypothetical protein